MQDTTCPKILCWYENNLSLWTEWNKTHKPWQLKHVEAKKADTYSRYDILDNIICTIKCDCLHLFRKTKKENRESWFIPTSQKMCTLWHMFFYKFEQWLLRFGGQFLNLINIFLITHVFPTAFHLLYASQS